MSLNELYEKYANDMSTIDKYMDSIQELFFSLCDSNDDLMYELPMLYKILPSMNIASNFEMISSEIDELQRKLENELQSIKLDDSQKPSVSINDSSADGDLLLYITSEIDKGNLNRDSLYNECQSILEALCITKGELVDGDRYHELYDNTEIVYKLIDTALYNHASIERKVIKHNLLMLQKMKKSMELFHTDSLMNIYRQCFIQIMSYFDSCIFELMKASLKTNYFYWLAKFKNNTIKSHDMAKFSSFEEFRDSHIEELLKSCYVKDLLSIFYNDNPSILLIDGEDRYSSMQELIGRRNVHIHNNGIADKAYTNNYNIHSISEGTYLFVTEQIVKGAEKLTQSIVYNIAHAYQNP